MPSNPSASRLSDFLAHLSDEVVPGELNRKEQVSSASVSHSYSIY